MRANLENKSMDIEAREINYILPAYLRQYLMESKNEDPDKIIFPMFPSAPHPYKPGVQIPIEWIPMTDPMVDEIAKDGSNVAEVTPEQEAALDEKDDVAKELKEQAENLQTPEVVVEEKKESIKSLPESLKGGPTVSDILEPVVVEATEEKISAAKASMKRISAEATEPPDRVPKMPPGGDLGTGHADGMGSRDARADRRIASDLVDDKEVDESAEIPHEIEKPKE